MPQPRTVTVLDRFKWKFIEVQPRSGCREKHHTLVAKSRRKTTPLKEVQDKIYRTKLNALQMSSLSNSEGFSHLCNQSA